MQDDDLKVDLNLSPQSAGLSIYSEMQFRFSADISRWWVRNRKLVLIKVDEDARTITFTPTTVKRPHTRVVSNKMVGCKRIIETMRASGCFSSKFSAGLVDRGIGSFQITY